MKNTDCHVPRSSLPFLIGKHSLEEIKNDSQLSTELRQRSAIAITSLVNMEDEHIADNYISISVTAIYQDAERERSRRQEEFQEY